MPLSKRTTATTVVHLINVSFKNASPNSQVGRVCRMVCLREPQTQFTALFTIRRKENTYIYVVRNVRLLEFVVQIAYITEDIDYVCNNMILRKTW